MEHTLPSLPNEFPDLPIDCSELQATYQPYHNKNLKDNLNKLPGLDTERFNRLSKVSNSTEYVGGSVTKPRSKVLGLNDLIRQDGNETVGLHPRVLHAVPLQTLDRLLETVCDLLDGDFVMNAYQYPNYHFECRGDSPDADALYPSDFHIRTADIARSLRANDILTSIRRPGQSFPREEEFQTVVKDIKDSGQQVEAIVTFFQSEEELEPSLYINADVSSRDNSPSEGQLVEHCMYLFHRHGLLLDIPEYDDQDGESR